MKLYLASTSPRRKELLTTLGIPFEVIAPHYEEILRNKLAKEEALYFAEQKALSVAQECPDALVLSSDTLIDCEGEVFGKPRSEKEARRMILRLSENTHDVFTAVVLLNTRTGEMQKHVEQVEILFYPLHYTLMDEYIESGEWEGKAGAYAVQGMAKSFVRRMVGDLNAVIGLPLEPLKKWLQSGDLV
ncbi:MAG: Maf family protein [Deltaproteobacteria bacterium]|nr:Maf family protein [Deltaproteobacteria bacterium]